MISNVLSMAADDVYEDGLQSTDIWSGVAAVHDDGSVERLPIPFEGDVSALSVFQKQADEIFDSLGTSVVYCIVPIHDLSGQEIIILGARDSEARSMAALYPLRDAGGTIVDFGSVTRIEDQHGRQFDLQVLPDVLGGDRVLKLSSVPGWFRGVISGGKTE